MKAYEAEANDRVHRFRLLFLALGVAMACLLGLWLPLTRARADDPTFPGRVSFGQKEDRTLAIATGDLDGDGDLDVVAGGGRSAVYFNDSLGNLREATQLGSGIRDLAVGDLDGDGDLDIATTGASGAVIYRNLGNEKFEAMQVSATAALTPSLALGDMNGDGSFDLIVGSGDGPTLIYTNTGSANFGQDAIKIGTEISQTYNLAVGHLDDDGCLDVVAGHGGGASVVYLNQRAVDGCALQFTAAPVGVAVTDTRKVVLGDFDGDEALDILEVRGIPYESGRRPFRLFRNDGQGRFQKEMAFSFGRGEGEDWGAAAGDLNGDGRLDLVAGLGTKPPTGSATWLNQIYLNDASDTLTPTLRLASNFGPGSDETRAVALADMNGDGALDIVAGNFRARNAIYFGKGELQPAARLVQTGKAEIVAVEVGDVTGDAAPDIVAAAMTGTMVFTNDHGIFTGSPFDPAEMAGDNYRVLVLADLIGDARPEIIVGYGATHTMVYSRSATEGWVRRSFGPARANAISIVAGDLDGDGRPDVVLGRSLAPNLVCRNRGDDPSQWPCEELPPLNTQQQVDTRSVAIADLNGDDALDIVTAVRGDANLVYLNDGQGGFTQGNLRTFGPGDDISHAVAVGDLNGDNAPDIVIGNFFEQRAVYFNDGKGEFEATPSRLLGSVDDRIYDLALVDVDNDGDLDIAAANWGGSATDVDKGDPFANALYVNDGKGNFVANRLDTDRSLGWTQSLAVGDLDGDGVAEIVAGNRYRDKQPFSDRKLIIYSLFPQRPPRLPNSAPYLIIDPPPAPDQDKHIPVHYRLFDPDGEALARVEAFVRAPGDDIWRPAASTDLTPTIVLLATKLGSSYVFTVDLAASHLTTQTQDAAIRLMVSPQLPFSPAADNVYSTSTPGPFQYPAFVASALLPLRPRSTEIAIRDNRSGARIYRSAASQKSLQPLREPSGAPMQTLENGQLPRRVRLAAGDQVAAVWPSTEVHPHSPISSRRGSMLVNTTRQYDCQPQQFQEISQGLFRRTVRIPITFPFPPRARAFARSTIRLGDERNLSDLKIQVRKEFSGARTNIIGLDLELQVPTSPTSYVVFPIPTGQDVIDLRDLGLDPRRVWLGGDWGLSANLQGCGRVRIDWQLDATISPLYYTSARPLTNGLDLVEVKTPGDPLTLTVSQPLLVFDLDIALEWDAHKDNAYRQQLQRDLLRASQILYDWTNGQAVLGRVNVYLDARRHPETQGFQPWLDSDVRIFASNRIRPSASQGGIVSDTYTKTLQMPGAPKNKVYYPGQVHMGVTWNRYGEQNTLGDDWPRALAHELGHYLFFLEDNYVGYDAGALVSVSGCPGAMADPYRDDSNKGYDEFTADMTWENPDLECGRTLSDQETGRSDWGTIKAFYPWLNTPDEVLKQKSGRSTTSGRGNAQEAEKCDAQGGKGCLVWEGPTQMVLDLTQINFVTPPSTANILDTPILTTVDDAGRSLPADANARVYLFKGGFHQDADAQLIDLGRPRGDQVFALGAAKGDQVCVLSGDQQGCATAEEREITLKPSPTWWSPEIALTPADAEHLAITVTLPSEIPSGIAVCGRLYPLDGDIYETVRLGASAASAAVYTATYVLPSNAPIVQGYLHIWSSDESDQARNSDMGTVDHCRATGAESYHAVTDFMIGSSAAFRKGTGAFRKGTGAPFRSSHAPVMSGDGQLILYWDKDFNTGEFLTIQTASSLPDLPSGAQVVGQAYRLLPVPASLDLRDAFINFNYLGKDVPPGQENALGIYHRDEASGEWLPLPTRVDPVQNQASARARGGGLYALLARLEIPLHAGWNLVGYPLPTHDVASRPSISESLQTLGGQYSVVYAFDASQPSAPWQVYDPDAAPWANSLGALEFGQGYLIHVSAPVTLSLAGGFESVVPYTTTLASADAFNALKTSAPDFGLPPAFYFTSITRTAELTFADDAALIAKVDGKVCGESPLHRIAATDAFTTTIAVPDANAVDPTGCRGKGKKVEFRLAGVLIGAENWANTQVQEIKVAAPSSTCHNLIRNGNFEDQGGWSLPSTRIPARIVTDPDDTDNHFLQLGAPPDKPAPCRSGRSIAQQSFSVPAQAAGMTLDLSYRSGSTATANDAPRTLLLDRRNLRQLAALSLPATTAGGWETTSIDLSAFAGRKVLLSFELTYNLCPNDARVWLEIDDVRACTSP